MFQIFSGRLFRAVESFKVVIFWCALISAIAATLEVVSVRAVSTLVEGLVGVRTGQFTYEGHEIYFSFAVFVLSGIALIARDWLMYVKLMPSFANHVRFRLFGDLVNQELALSGKVVPRSLGPRLMQCGMAARNLTTDIVNVIVFVGSRFLASAVLFAIVDPVFLIPVFLWGILIFFRVFFALHQIKEGAKDIARSSSELSAKVSDIFAYFTSIVSYSRKPAKSRLIKDAMRSDTDINFCQMRRVFGTLRDLHILNMGLLCTNMFITFSVARIATSGIADLTTVAAASLGIISMATGLLWQINNLTNNFGRLESILELLQEEAPPFAEEVPSSLLTPKLVLQNVNIVTPEGGNIFIEDCEIVGGGSLALVGQSGIGKTTALNALFGIHDAYSGHVTLNGTPISSMRRYIAYMAQDDGLFRASLRENLRFDRDDIGDEKLIDTLQLLRIKLIRNTATKQDQVAILDRIVEPGDLVFSGGEARRICFARALLSDAAVVLLDEPTVGLDTENVVNMADLISTHFPNQVLIVATHSDCLRDACTTVRHLTPSEALM